MALDKVTTGIIADNAVSTAKVADDAVTGAKIENNPTVAGNLTVAGTSTLTGNVTVTGDIVPSSPLSNRNMIINGAQRIWQRGDSFTGTGSSRYNGDRFKYEGSSLGAWTISRAGDYPTGFSASTKFLCTTADASPGTNDHGFLQYRMEGQDLRHLKKGSADALPTTLSFWVKTNLTGTWQVNLQDQDNNRIIGKTYTVTAANTWEHKSLTFAGDTTGVYSNDSGLSLIIEWALGAGTGYSSGAVPTAWESHSGGTPDRAAGMTVNLASATNNTFFITGVQYEVGSTATPFEHITIGDDQIRCQRYFEKSYNQDRAPGTSGGDQAQGMLAYREGYSGNARRDIAIRFATTKRALPTMTAYAPNGTSGKVNSPNGPNTTAATFTDTGNSGSIVYAQPTSGSYYQCHFTAESEI